MIFSTWKAIYIKSIYHAPFFNQLYTNTHSSTKNPFLTSQRAQATFPSSWQHPQPAALFCSVEGAQLLS